MNPNDHSNAKGSAGGKRPPKPPPVPRELGSSGHPPLLEAGPPKWMIGMVAVAAGFAALICVVVVVLAISIMKSSDVPPVQISEFDVPAPSHLSEPHEPPDLPEPYDVSEPYDLSEFSESPEPSDLPEPTDLPDLPEPPESLDLSEPPKPSDLSQPPALRPAAPADPFQDIRDRQNRLSLPPLMVTEGLGAFARQRLNSATVELARLPVKDLQACELKLSGQEFEARGGWRHTIVVVDQDDLRRWEVITEEPSALGPFQATKTATFTLQNGVLAFNWQTAQPPFRLTFCLLEITVDGRTETCTFETAVRTVPTFASWEDVSGRIALLEADKMDLRPDDNLVLQLKLDDQNAAGPPERMATLTRGHPRTTIRIPLPKYHDRAPDPEISVELAVTYAETAESITAVWLESRLVVDAPVLNHDRTTRTPWSRENWSRASLEVELTEQAIDRHRKERTRWADGQLEKLMTLARSSSSFKDLARWAEEPPEERAAVLEYAALQVNLAPFQTELRKSRRARRPLNEEDEQPFSDSQARLSDLEEQVAGLVKEYPQASAIFKRYRLDQRENMEIAKTHDLFADFVREVDLWAEVMNRFLTYWHEAGRLDYRLYLMIDDREIDLVVTEAF